MGSKHASSKIKCETQSKLNPYNKFKNLKSDYFIQKFFEYIKKENH